MIVNGGINICGITIGVLSLESYFPKLPGHIKNPNTFNFPVTYRVVRGATTKRLIEERDPALLKPFIEAVRELERDGVHAITGSCGFLVLFQQELADAVQIPVFTSSLIQLPMVHHMLKRGQKVGIITASKPNLTDAHLAAVGAEITPVCIAGMDDQPEFWEVIIENKRNELDFTKLEAEILSVAQNLQQDHPEIGAIILECTDMCSFAHTIQQHLKLPVFDLTTLTCMVHDAVARRPYQDFMAF